MFFRTFYKAICKQTKKKPLEVISGQDIFMFMYIFVGHCVSSYSIMQLSKLFFCEEGPFGGKTKKKKKAWRTFVYDLGAYPAEVFKIFYSFLYRICKLH